MNTSLLHLEISLAGDLLVFETPLQSVYSLSHTLRIAFKHNPQLIRWNCFNDPHGLACLRWAQETDFAFEVVSVRGLVTVSTPPLMKGLRLSRRDGEQALYLPCNVFPHELDSRSKQGSVHLATPWFLAKELRLPAAGHHLEGQFVEPNEAIELPRPLPSSLCDPVKDVLAWAGSGSHGDFVL